MLGIFTESFSKCLRQPMRFLGMVWSEKEYKMLSQVGKHERLKKPEKEFLEACLPRYHNQRPLLMKGVVETFSLPRGLIGPSRKGFDRVAISCKMIS